MSTFEPTLFTLAENISLNDEQLAAQLAYHEVATLRIFDNRLFCNIHEFATNHLLVWCSEVLTAYQLGCFDDGDESHNHAKRMLLYRFKQFFVHSRHTLYQDVVPFSIDWNEYITLNNVQTKSQTDSGKSFFVHDIDAFLANIPIYRSQWGVDGFHDDILKAMAMKKSIRGDDNVRMGEDTKIAAGVEDIPDTIGHILAEPLNLQGGTRKYYGCKTKAAAHKTQRQHKMAQNARRVEGSKKVLAKGYNIMPKDRALQISAGVFVPTIFIDTINAHNQFKQDFPPAERQHGFMVSCKGQVLYWNTLTQDFGPELVELP